MIALQKLWQILFVSFQCLVLGVKDNIWEQSNYSTGKAKYLWSCISWAVWTPWWDLGAKPQETKPMAMMEATQHNYIVHSCTLEHVSIPNVGVITTPVLFCTYKHYLKWKVISCKQAKINCFLQKSASWCDQLNKVVNTLTIGKNLFAKKTPLWEWLLYNVCWMSIFGIFSFWAPTCFMEAVHSKHDQGNCSIISALILLIIKIA